MRPLPQDSGVAPLITHPPDAAHALWSVEDVCGTLSLIYRGHVQYEWLDGAWRDAGMLVLLGRESCLPFEVLLLPVRIWLAELK